MNYLNNSKNDLDSEELIRYSRHITLPEIGIQGQKKLKSASVLCIGSGGLGSPLMLYLAAAGIGRIGIVDFDIVEESNLQRQIIHNTTWIGKKKTSSARSRILELNPYCQVDLFETTLTTANALEIIKEYDVICDGTDNFPSRYLINDSCVLLGKPNVYGSVHRFEGQASVFNLKESSPNYRDLIPEPPPANIIPSCTEAGVFGVLPGIIGIVQATEVIKIISGIGNPLDGRLLVIDALTMTFKELKLSKLEHSKKIERLIDYHKFCGVQKCENPIERSFIIGSISVKDLKQLINNIPKDILVIDVRSRSEAEINSINESKLIPLERIETGEAIEEIRKLSLGKRLFICCKSGIRSEKALRILKSHSINGLSLAGGMEAWEASLTQS